LLTVILGIAVCLMMTLPAAGAPEKPELYRQGQEVFTANCADCHRSNGEGLPGTIPSLAKSP
jgi:mono/diheme cytochrome c family protein